jgi:hypothetical protein
MGRGCGMYGGKRGKREGIVVTVVLVDGVRLDGWLTGVP